MTAFLLNAQYSPITINRGGNVVNTNGTITFSNSLVASNIVANSVGQTNIFDISSFTNGLIASGAFTVNGVALFTNDVILSSGNLYITNHAYDVSTSQFDPIANEYVTAGYVQSIMAANFDLYFSTNSSGITVTNGAGGLFIPSTMVLVNPTTSQTNTISSFTNGTYFTARLQTNSISYIQSVPINLYTYVQITGGGSVVAHPEIWLYNTNGTIVQLGYSSDNTYSSGIAVPVNLSIAMTNTAYLNVNLTNSPQLLLRWYVTSSQGNPTWRFLIGAGNVAHITVGTIPSANQNYVGTFTGNGAGLTNIYSTNIVTQAGTLAVASAATNYTVNLLPGGMANLQQIYLANTNCYITFTGTNVIDSQRAVLFRGWTNTVVSTLTFALPTWRTNYTTANYFVTNGQSAVFNFYNTDTTGSNVMVSDGGRWK